MAEIDKFRNPMEPGYDLWALRHDILTRLVNDYAGPENSVTTAQLTRLYFGRVDFESKWFIGQQIQACRQILEDNGLLLRSHHFHWYVVSSDQEAKGFIDERAARFVRAHQRLVKATDIAVDSYGLPAGDRLVQAIQGATPMVEQIAASRKELPEGKEEQD